jgi:hypothetical protein
MQKWDNFVTSLLRKQRLTIVAYPVFRLSVAFDICCEF